MVREYQLVCTNVYIQCIFARFLVSHNIPNHWAVCCRYSYYEWTLALPRLALCVSCIGAWISACLILFSSFLSLTFESIRYSLRPIFTYNTHRVQYVYRCICFVFWPHICFHILCNAFAPQWKYIDFVYIFKFKTDLHITWDVHLVQTNILYFALLLLSIGVAFGFGFEFGYVYILSRKKSALEFHHRPCRMNNGRAKQKYTPLQWGTKTPKY